VLSEDRHERSVPLPGAFEKGFSGPLFLCTSKIKSCDADRGVCPERVARLDGSNRAEAGARLYLGGTEGQRTREANPRARLRWNGAEQRNVDYRDGTGSEIMMSGGDACQHRTIFTQTASMYTLARTVKPRRNQFTATLQVARILAIRREPSRDSTQTRCLRGGIKFPLFETRCFL
jgi:hypothetical protein